MNPINNNRQRWKSYERDDVIKFVVGSRIQTDPIIRTQTMTKDEVCSMSYREIIK